MFRKISVYDPVYCFIYELEYLETFFETFTTFFEESYHRHGKK